MRQASSGNPVFSSRAFARAARNAAWAVCLSIGAVAMPAAAQQPAAAAAAGYKPNVGQEGKDVVWVPTPQSLVEKMLDMAQVKPGERLLDLGSGDGRTVITAARRGLQAQGIEYNPQMAELARRNAAQAGMGDRATFATADLFESDLSQADVITMFLLPSINERLRPRLLELKPGTRVVSNSFRMGDWEPDQSETLDTTDCSAYCTALLWIVPAKVQGNWRMEGQSLQLTQAYQKVAGTLGATPISEGWIDGNAISFMADGLCYTGTIDGKAIKGNYSGSREGAWSASLQ